MRSRVAADVSALAAPALAIGTLMVGAGAVMSAPAEASGACSSATSGVTVVVQFPSGSAVGCAPGSPGTALNALRSAGFATTGTRTDGDGFLCSINSFPVAGVCPVTPQSDRTWFVFSAPRGGSWAFAPVGVTLLHPAPGSVIGFHYGSSAPLSVPVPAKVSAPKPPSSQTSHPSSKPHETAPARPSGTKATSGATPKKPASTPSTASTAHPTASSAPVVTSMSEKTVNGAKRKVITFSDGSTSTVASDSKDAARYSVGAPKPGGSSSAPSPSSTSVPPTSVTSHPSISTSGSVPAVPRPEAKSDGGTSNLPGILTGAGVLGVAAAGGGYAAYRRRG